jgi:4-hydroxy-tetrahydrodipicolinate reductase
MAQPIKVVVHGALGKVGREVLNALCRYSQLEPVGAVDKRASEEKLSLPDQSGYIPLSSNLEAVLELSHPDVLVDFSVAEATLPAVRIAVKHRVSLVIGTTGLSAENLAEIDQLATANGVGAIAAPNFALGAVVMIHLAKIAARFFDWAEILEMHHEQKLDAPSGTALSTARAMLEARGKPFLYSKVQKESLSGSRGGELEGIALHSMRLPGLMAHQEVILGTAGQTLTIRHDTINRECYMPGVVLAIQKVGEIKGLTYGLDALLGL